MKFTLAPLLLTLVVLTTMADAENVANVEILDYSTRLGLAWHPPFTLDGDPSTFWITSKNDPAPFITYQFTNEPVELGVMTVINRPDTYRLLNTAIVSYREGDAGEFTQLGDGPIQFAASSNAVTEVDFGGAVAKYVTISILTAFDGTNVIDVSAADGSNADYLVGFADVTFGIAPGVAAAGPDQTVYDADDDGDELITLDGTASAFPDGTITDYLWSEDGSPIATGATAQANLLVGVHTVTLTVTTSDGTTDDDEVVVEIVGTPQTFAVAGLDQTVVDSDMDGSELVTLDGSASGWNVVQWDWSIDATPLATGETADITLALGDHVITLVCTDLHDLTDTDTVTIHILDGTPKPPVADAGFDRTVMDINDSGAAAVTLDGSDSTDPDGTIVSYVWTEAGAPIATGATPEVSLTIGVHAITLTVTDDDGSTDTDDVTVTVVPYEEGPTDAPYAGGWEADHDFADITADDMAVIRSKKILMASRSFGLNLTDGFTRLRNIDPMYSLNIAGGFNVRVEGPEALPLDVFDNANFVQYLCEAYPTTERFVTYNTLVRTRYADVMDAGLVFLSLAELNSFDFVCSVMDSLILDYPGIKWIICTPGLSPIEGDSRNIDGTTYRDMLLTRYRKRVPVYDMADVFSTRIDDSVCTFEQGGQDYLMMCPEYNINGDNIHPNSAVSEERMAKAMLVLLKTIFITPPTVPGDADGDADVDLDDFVVLKTNFGATTSAGASAGDFDNDGDVDLDDFVILKTNFGT